MDNKVGTKNIFFNVFKTAKLKSSTELKLAFKRCCGSREINCDQRTFGSERKKYISTFAYQFGHCFEYLSRKFAGISTEKSRNM